MTSTTPAADTPVQGSVLLVGMTHRTVATLEHPATYPGSVWSRYAARWTSADEAATFQPNPTADRAAAAVADWDQVAADRAALERVADAAELAAAVRNAAAVRLANLFVRVGHLDPDPAVLAEAVTEYRAARTAWHDAVAAHSDAYTTFRDAHLNT